MSKTVLITGATGRQGGAVIKNLLKRDADFEILALTRNIHSHAAQKLLSLSPSIKLVSGNLDRPDDIFKTTSEVADEPIWGVFSVQASIGYGINSHTEERQGKGLIDASLNHGVKYFIYASGDRGGLERSDNDPTNVPHFNTKYHIEKHLEKTKTGGMDWTILRPVEFYENLEPGFLGKLFSTSWKMNLGEERKLQLVATKDVGFFAAQAFIRPEEFKGKKISLAGDELTYEEFESIFKHQTGKDLPMTYNIVGTMINNVLESELGHMFRWFRDFGYGADIHGLREIHPELMDFGTWLEKESLFRKSC